MEISFHRLAVREYVAARRRYARRSEDVAGRFQQAVRRAVQQIVDGPEQWPIFRGHYHWVKTRRFPYVLYYEIAAEGRITVLAVAHGHRRLGYWTRRSSS